MLRPKILDALKGYTAVKFAKDGMAGVIVGIVALPLAIAFAIASGVTPDKGLVTAVIAGFMISAFGGSRVQIGGPTGAFVVIVYGIVHQYGLNGLLAATFMAGIILMIFGFAKLGSIIKFIPHSVIVGFTFGIAVIIFTGQISEFLGLGISNMPADFVDKFEVIFSNLGSVNIFACAIALATLIIIVLIGRISKKIPGSLVAIVATSLAVFYFKLPVETIGARFGDIPSSLPAPSFMSIDFKTVLKLLNPAFTIAMLGAIESLLSAVVADGMIGGKHRSNMELVAQGMANVVSPLFGGIPATGAIARTATNVKSGGRTPVAGIVHALTLLAIMLFFGKYVAYIPMACLAGILMVVAFHMSEYKSVLSLIRLSKGSALVILTTVVLTILVDLTAAIEVGLILATFVFIRNMSIQTSVSSVGMPDKDDENTEPDFDNAEKLLRELPKGAVLYEITGPLFFGAVYKLREALAELDRFPKVLIVQLKNVPVVDSTGAHVLKESMKMLSKKGTKVIFCGIRPNIEGMLERGEIISPDRSNTAADLAEAVAKAAALISVK